MYFYEAVSGARMHAAYYRPIFGNRTMPMFLVNDVLFFIQNFQNTLSEINTVLVNNKVWKSRLCGLGLISVKNVEDFGLTGVMARSTGCKIDLRMPKESYCLYKYSGINSYVSEMGDCYDRYNLRMYEMVESSNIINYVISNYFINNKVSYSNNSLHFNSMEGTIQKFKLWSGSYTTNCGTSYSFVESAKGIFGVNM